MILLHIVALSQQRIILFQQGRVHSYHQKQSGEAINIIAAQLHIARMLE